MPHSVFRKNGIAIQFPYESPQGNVIPSASWFLNDQNNNPADHNLTGPHTVTSRDDVAYDADTQKVVRQDDGNWISQDLPMEEARARKKASIDAQKQEKQLEGFTYDNMTFQCDEVSVSRIHATWSFAQADNSYTQPFVLKDNSTVTLTNAQCLGLGVACGQFVSELTFTARQLKDAVLAAATVAEVRAITWPE